ncbi:IS6 family transposase, partial [Vibrio cyclitrophicus]|nr:IS6 family transposase [Vibrio cyclitrophicus]NOI36734.1 IS6 family transposase [Vibrio cyclitrophicus]
GALASLHRREVWTMLKQDQIDIVGQTAFERFYALAV